MSRNVKTGQLSPVAVAGVSVAQTSVAIAGSNATRIGLYVFNTDGTDTLWVSPSGKTAAANGSGSVAIQPLQGQVFSGDLNWTNGMNAVYSANTHSPTVLELFE